MERCLVEEGRLDGAKQDRTERYSVDVSGRLASYLYVPSHVPGIITTMERRRGHGEGTIHQRPDGRWEARLDVGWMDGHRQRRSVYGRTRAEVAAKLRKAQGQADRGLPLGDKRLTVADLLRRWLELQRTAGKSPNTVANYEWAVRVHLIPALGRIRLSDLSADHVDALLAARARAGASKSTLVRLRSILGMALDHAVRRDLVARNVAALTDPPAGTKKPGRSLTVDEAMKLLRHAEGDRLAAAYMAQLMVGLRPGEVLGLTWDDVDLDRAHLRVRQALKLENGKRLFLGPLKTKASRRTLALPVPVVEALRAHRRRQLQERMTLGLRPEIDLVFTTIVGTPVNPSNYRRSFASLTERAGLGRWHPHELRHSAVSLLSAAGLRLEDVADVVGHSSTRMTADVYRHLVEPTITAGKAAMDQIFAAQSQSFGGQFGGQSQ
jgi:integrase